MSFTAYPQILSFFRSKWEFLTEFLNFGKTHFSLEHVLADIYEYGLWCCACFTESLSFWHTVPLDSCTGKVKPFCRALRAISSDHVVGWGWGGGGGRSLRPYEGSPRRRTSRGPLALDHTFNYFVTSCPILK